MDSYRAMVALHILLGIVLTGQALFWFVMSVALRRDADEKTTLELLRTTQAARWPHVAVPWKLRLPLPWVTWLTVALLVLSGIAMIQSRGSAPETLSWYLKLLGLAFMVLLQGLIQMRPGPGLIKLNLFLVLATMVFAGLSIR